MSPRAKAQPPHIERPASFDTGVWTWVRVRRFPTSPRGNGDHRRVPPADLMLAATAQHADVVLVHYDRGYERIAATTDLHHQWLVPDGTLADEPQRR